MVNLRELGMKSILYMDDVEAKELIAGIRDRRDTITKSKSRKKSNKIKVEPLNPSTVNEYLKSLIKLSGTDQKNFAKAALSVLQKDL
mgnify:CR=1 FL=1